ncbi:hypothetical protein ACH4MG_27405 [Streptomyces sp. NPDC017454]|uniref:hypothetical protein n=1 Tax=unclassified Streptomyces TaxID=2593676 RepID=UPI003321404B
MPDRLTDQQLTDIDNQLAAYRQHAPTGFACCSAHPVADAVPVLLAEVRRLQAELARRVQCGDCGAVGDVATGEDGRAYLYPSGQIGH